MFLGRLKYVCYEKCSVVDKFLFDQLVYSGTSISKLLGKLKFGSKNQDFKMLKVASTEIKL